MLHAGYIMHRAANTWACILPVAGVISVSCTVHRAPWSTLAVDRAQIKGEPKVISLAILISARLSGMIGFARRELTLILVQYGNSRWTDFLKMRKTRFEGKRENCINEARRSCEGNRQYGCFVKSKSLTISLISRVSQLRFRSSSRIIPLSHKPRNVSLPFVSRKIYGTRGNERKIEIEFKVFLNCDAIVYFFLLLFFFQPR